MIGKDTKRKKSGKPALTPQELAAERRAAGEALKRTRERLGLTPRELAERLGVARTTVVLWEGGRMPLYGPTKKHLQRVLRDLQRA